MNRKYSAIATFAALLGCFAIVQSEATMSLNGPVSASAVVVSGSVTVSSMTVSSMTVLNSMQVNGTTNGVKGLVCQTVSTSTVVASTSTSTTLVSIPGMSANIALLNSQDYVRISISGSLQASSLLLPPSYAPQAHLSFARDGVDLGHGALATTTNGFVTPVGWSGFFIKMNVGDLAVPCFGIDALRDGSILRKTVDGLFQNGERRRTLPVMC